MIDPRGSERKRLPWPQPKMVALLPMQALTSEAIPQHHVRHVEFMPTPIIHSRCGQLSEGTSRTEDAVVEAYFATDDVFSGTQ